MLSDDALKNLTADKVVDARGTACPGPLLAAKQKIAEVGPDQVMEVQSTDVGTKRDIPKWCNKMGHEYLGTVEESGYFRIFLKKK